MFKKKITLKSISGKDFEFANRSQLLQQNDNSEKDKELVLVSNAKNTKEKTIEIDLDLLKELSNNTKDLEVPFMEPDGTKVVIPIEYYPDPYEVYSNSSEKQMKLKPKDTPKTSQEKQLHIEGQKNTSTKSK